MSGGELDCFPVDDGGGSAAYAGLEVVDIVSSHCFLSGEILIVDYIRSYVCQNFDLCWWRRFSPLSRRSYFLG